jgi:hypothetical protein
MNFLIQFFGATTIDQVSITLMTMGQKRPWACPIKLHTAATNTVI